MFRLSNIVLLLTLVAILFPFSAQLRRTTERDSPHTTAQAGVRLAPNPSWFAGESNTATQGSSDTLEKHFAVTIHRPSGPPTLQLPTSDPQGRVAQVACSTCHSVREPNPANRSPEDLDEFHQGMQFRHGQLSCYACHHPDDADSLRLADGTRLSYPDVMSLCSQCHGPQATAFAHGAHGGMNGFWDLSRGPQQRNNCIDCHDPHAPSYPKMIPTFKPRDRFLAAESDSSHDDSSTPHEPGETTDADH